MLRGSLAGIKIQQIPVFVDERARTYGTEKTDSEGVAIRERERVITEHVFGRCSQAAGPEKRDYVKTLSKWVLT